ncbi:MAG: hypothetical protein ABSG83_20490 [Roseiarcus sp.]|jgi:hypothetical protein
MLLVRFVEPGHRQRRPPKTDIDERDIRVEGGILLILGFQLRQDLERFVPAP